MRWNITFFIVETTYISFGPGTSIPELLGLPPDFGRGVPNLHKPSRHCPCHCMPQFQHHRHRSTHLDLIEIEMVDH